MNLVLDIGNTLVKYAVFNSGILLRQERSEPELFLVKIKSLFKHYSGISHAIISSVGSISKKDRDVVTLFCKAHLLTAASRVPFKNSYATPHTLGTDRMALATAAFYCNAKRNTLVIGIGTCITYDMVNDAGEYMGGAISPGIQMRYSVLNSQTASLPLLKLESAPLDFIGNTTQSCMHSGVINGMTQEIDGVIRQYRSRFHDVTVILTGGDAHFFVKKLKSPIFANSEFLLEGLNYLLEYNK